MPPPEIPELLFLNMALLEIEFFTGPSVEVSVNVVSFSRFVLFVLVAKLRLISHANCSGLMKLSMKNISFPSESWTACLL